MQNQISEGERISFTAPSGGIVSGQMVVIGSKVGVATISAAEGERAVAQLEGVFELPKATGAINQGDAVFYDTENEDITTIGTGNIFAGYAFKSEVSGATTVQVALACDVKPRAATQADSEATTVDDLKTDFNALLSKLKAAGIMANA